MCPKNLALKFFELNQIFTLQCSHDSRSWIRVVETWCLEKDKLFHIVYVTIVTTNSVSWLNNIRRSEESMVEAVSCIQCGMSDREFAWDRGGLARLGPVWTRWRGGVWRTWGVCGWWDGRAWFTTSMNSVHGCVEGLHIGKRLNPSDA